MLLPTFSGVTSIERKFFFFVVGHRHLLELDETIRPKILLIMWNVCRIGQVAEQARHLFIVQNRDVTTKLGVCVLDISFLLFSKFSLFKINREFESFTEISMSAIRTSILYIKKLLPLNILGFIFISMFIAYCYLNEQLIIAIVVVCPNKQKRYRER